MTAPALCRQRKTPVKVVARTLSQASSERRRSRLSSEAAALQTSTSSRCHRSTAADTIAATFFASRTSA